MASLLPIKLSISDFTPQDTSYLLSDLSLTLTFNNIIFYFNPPYNSLSLHLVNFPMVSTLHLKFFLNSSLLFESTASIQELHHKQSISLNQSLRSAEETSLFERSLSLERTKSFKSVGFFKLLLEKENAFAKNCQMCSVFENFSSISERALEMIIEANKGSINALGRIEELSMEIHDMYENKEITEDRIRNIRCMLIGVGEKLKMFELYRERYEQAIGQVELEQKCRENMQNSFKAACKEFISSKNVLEAQALQLEKTVKILTERNLALSGIEKVYQDFRTSNDIEINMLKSSMFNLKKQSMNNSTFQELISTLTSNSEFKENVAKIQKNEFDKVTEGYKALIAEFQECLSSLSHENLSLIQNSEKLSKINSELTNKNNSLIIENQTLKNQILEYETKLIQFPALQEQIQKFEQSNLKIQSDYKSLQQQMDKISKRYHEGTRGLFNDKKILLDHNKNLTEENGKLKYQFNLIHSQHIALQKKIAIWDIGSETRTFVFLNKQNIKLLTDIKELCEASNRIEIEMLKEFTLVIKSLLDTSGKHLMMQRLQTRILMILKDKDVENNILRDLIAKVQRGLPVYIPVRGDYVDNQLANFLNSSPTVCEVPFVRLEPNLYLFGSKKVVLRVENMEIVSNYYIVRVGGGFLKLQDFIAGHERSEISKIFSSIERIEGKVSSTTDLRISPRTSGVGGGQKGSPRSPKSPKFSIGTESGSSLKSPFMSADLYKSSPKVQRSSMVSPVKKVISPRTSPKRIGLKSPDSRNGFKIGQKGIFN